MCSCVLPDCDSYLYAAPGLALQRGSTIFGMRLAECSHDQSVCKGPIKRRVACFERSAFICFCQIQNAFWRDLLWH